MIHDDLTPQQREILVAVMLNGVPIDVLAERLDMTRNSLNNTIRDARRRLRVALADRRFDVAEFTEAAKSGQTESTLDQTEEGQIMTKAEYLAELTAEPLYPRATAEIAERRKQLAPEIHDAFQESAERFSPTVRLTRRPSRSLPWPWPM